MKKPSLNIEGMKMFPYYPKLKTSPNFETHLTNLSKRCSSAFLFVTGTIVFESH
jgi:hypothetical protein